MASTFFYGAATTVVCKCLVGEETVFTAPPTRAVAP